MSDALQVSQPMILQHCTIQTDDMAEWIELSNSERELIRERLNAMREILSEKRRTRACAIVAARYIDAKDNGWSWQTLHRLSKDFERSGYDWRVLKRAYKNGKEGLPKQFICFYRELLLRSARKTSGRAAYRELIAMFGSGASIPGYGTKYEWAKLTGRPVPSRIPTKQEIPDGWTYRNLSRIKPKNKYALELTRSGFAAAHSYAPDMVLKDRSQLRFMEYVAFDDVRLDNKCLIEIDGMKRQIGYPLSVMAIDVATGCDVAHCVKPRINRETDGTKYGIASEEVRCLILNIIEQYGLPPYPVTFIIENAAATLSEADEVALKQTFGDRIRIQRCATMNEVFLENGFHETGGKPWCKAWIEVFFRSLQEHLSFLDAATGRRYDDNPAPLKKAEQYVMSILKLAADREDIIKQFKLPMPNFEEIQYQILRVLDILRHRKDHNLQGFDTITEWRKDKYDIIRPKEELANLSSEELAEVEIFDRLESPAERVIRLAAQVEWWRPHVGYYVHLYALKHVFKFAIRSGGLMFTAKKLKRHKAEKITDNLVYESPSAEVIEKYYDAELLCYFEDDLSMAHLTKDGRFICSLRRKKRINIADEHELKKAGGEAYRRSMCDRNIIRELMPNTEMRLADMRNHNSQTLKAAGLLGDSINKSRIERNKEIKDKKRNLNFLEEEMAAIAVEEDSYNPREDNDLNIEDLL